MKETIKIVIHLSIMALLTLLPSFGALAMESNDPVNINEYDSIYKYNALENKVVFFPDVGGALAYNSGEEKSSQSNSDNQASDDIVQKIQDIKGKTDFSVGEIDRAIVALKNTNALKAFLVGDDVGIIKFQLVQIKDQVSMLNALAILDQDNKNKIQIDEQIKFLQEEQTKVENFIREHNSKFSLFGWFVDIM